MTVNKLAGKIPARRSYPSDGAAHGSYSRYSHGCRCELCRGAQRGYYRAHRDAYIAAAMRRYHRTHPAAVAAPTAETPAPEPELGPLDSIADRARAHEFIDRLSRVAWDSRL